MINKYKKKNILGGLWQEECLKRIGFQAPKECLSQTYLHLTTEYTVFSWLEKNIPLHEIVVDQWNKNWV